MLEKFSSYAIYPLFVLHHRIVEPCTQWMAKRRTVEGLERALTMVQAERDELMAEAIELRSESRYQSDTKELDESNKLLADAVVCKAQIIAKNFSDAAHYLLIDAGASKGVAKDMVVIYKQCLVGKVTDVYPWYSKVLPITDRACKVSACCLQTKALGVHEGRNLLYATSLNYVSHLEAVQVGDYIISSGEGLIFPRGLGIGQILSCSQDGLYHVVEVKPLVDLQSITYCTVIQRGKAEMPQNATCLPLPNIGRQG
jgi:rod shape-determining protein MreC